MHVSYVPDRFTCETIGGADAAGICGSGIVDLVSELFMSGLIDLKGRLVPEKSSHICLKKLPGTDLSQYAIEYAPGLFFYQKDLDEFIRTKAAAFTMMDILMNEVGLSLSDMEYFYMCGSFGAHIVKESAISA